MADEYVKAALYGISNFNRKAKEKIGMGKLLILIDIYEEEVVGVHSVGEKITDKEEARIISKKFGFIKWLVENEKINFKKFDGDNCDYLENPIGSNNYDECDYLDLIQWLAISDAPIDDLIYYLK